jgi:hypothetical protein
MAFAILDAGGSGTAVGVVSAAGTVPAVLFFVIGGVVADRLPRHLVIRTGLNGAQVAGAALGGVLIAGFGPSSTRSASGPSRCSARWPRTGSSTGRASGDSSCRATRSG